MDYEGYGEEDSRVLGRMVQPGDGDERTLRPVRLLTP